MSRAKCVDMNQKLLIAHCKRIPGVSVQLLSDVGKGVPDVLLGYRGRNLLIEIKRDDVSPSRSKLNARQERWHSEWNGQVAVVRNVADIWRVLDDD